MPRAFEPYIPNLLLSKIASSAKEASCRLDESMKLFDDNPLTCMTIQGVLEMTIAPRDTLHQLIILTRDMDCAQRFHVSVYVKRRVNKCNKMDLSQLVSFSYVRGTTLRECVYAVPQDDGTL